MLEITTLGGLVIRENGTTKLSFAFRKEEALLVYLARTQREHSREVLAELLWNDRSQAQAMSNLRVIVHNLKQRLAPYLLITRQTIGLKTDHSFQLDVNELETTLNYQSNLRTPNRKLDKATIAAWEQSLSLFRGEFLEGFSVKDSNGMEDWILSERERIHNGIVDALAQLSTCYMADGMFSAAIAKARRLLEIDPTHEKTHRQLMTMLVQSGQRSAALNQYEICRRRLEEDVAVEPDEETIELYEAIRTRKLRSISDSSHHQHNLPLAMTTFIGRVEELEQIVKSLINPECRLLTLTGHGGVGKTRLALQAANNLIAKFENGCYFVPLTNIASSDLLLVAIAEMLDFTFYSQRDQQSQVINYLHDKQLLLILDDFAHLVDEADLLSVILSRAPGVKIMVTSVEKLHLQEEWIIHISGMQHPLDSITSQAENYDSVQLFVQTAIRSQPTFRLSDENRDSVIRICQLVEGMPLAVELAAAWTRIIPCSQIAEKITKDLDFLTTSSRNIPERHRNLRVVFENSWRLLTESEQNTFMRLSVFQGSFSMEAAEAVAGASFFILTALVDKSMVRTDSSGRLNLQELIKQFAYDKLLASGELNQVHQNHVTYFLALSENKNQLSKSGNRDHASLLKSFELEMHNWRVALDWCLNQVLYSDLGLRLAWSLWRFWQMGGFSAEGLRFLEQMLIQTNSKPPSLDRLRALVGAGMLSVSQGDLIKADNLSRESLLILNDIVDEECRSLALNVQGTVARSYGNYSEASQYYSESFACAKQIGDSWLVGMSLSNQGLVDLYRRNYEHAAQLLEEALSIYQRLQSSFDIALVLNLLGRVAQQRDELVLARKLCKMALELCLECGNKWGAIIGLSTLAGVYTAQGEPERAVRLLGAEDALREAIHSALPPGIRTGHAGNLNAARIQMDAINFATAWSEGCAMTFQQAVDYALDTTDFQ